MSRGIKFRIWDDEKKEWLGGSDDYVLYYYGFHLVDEAMTVKTPPQWEWTLDEGMVVEQYTGLEDNNGKEIYEGDILEDDYDHAVGMVKYGIHNCACCHSVYGFSTVDQNGEIVEMSLVDAEVVGNIHENPELLVEDKND